MEVQIKKRLEIGFEKLGESAEAFEAAGFTQLAGLLYGFASRSLLEIKDNPDKVLDAETYDETLKKIFEMGE